MKHASESPFAQRMMERLIPSSLDVDENSRHFYDPPEKIQQWFGGRGWFISMNNTKIHRVGLFKGLGWEFDPNFLDHRGYTGVRITARARRHDGAQFYDMEFMTREVTYDEAGFQVGFNDKCLHHIPGLAGEELKAAYAAHLGDHAI